MIKKRYPLILGFMLMLSACTNDISSSVPSSEPSEMPSISTPITSIDDGTSSEPSSEKPVESVVYRNPVIPTDFPDPAVVRGDDGYFYTYATGSKMARSRDFATWEMLGRAIDQPTWGTTGANIWAPEVRKIGDNYVMYYSLSRWDDTNPGIGIATATNPGGPWTDHGKFFTSAEIGVNNSIDAVAYVDDDNRVYLVWGSFRGLYGIELTADGLGFIDGSVEAAAANKVLLAGYDTERAFAIDTYEAPYIIKKDNYYYLFVSNGQCCSGSYSYNIRVGRSTSVLGVYTDKDNRDMRNGDVGTYVVYASTQFYAPGHNSVFIDDVGDYWILYHAYPENVTNRRVMLLDKLLWDDGGFPHTLGYTPSNNRKMGPSLFITK